MNIKDIKNVFITYGYPECHHSHEYPCNHCLEVKQIDQDIFTAEIDQDLDWDKRELTYSKWIWELKKLGISVLDKIDNSSGEAQWNGAVWILRGNNNVGA